MGLFGYGKSDYNANTASFKKKLDELHTRCGNQLGVGKLISAIIAQLDITDYPKGNSKEQKAIDERIDALITAMNRDLQQGSPARLSSHANMLLSAIKESRSFGQERYNADELNAQEQMAQCQGEIYDALDRKGVIAETKAGILQRASKTKDQAEIAKLRMQYNEFEKEEAALDKNITVFQSRYNQFVDVVNQRKVGTAARKLQNTQIVSLKDFTKEVAETNQILSEQAAIDQGFSEVIADANSEFGDAYGNATFGGSFDAMLDAEKNKKLGSAIDGMSAPSAPAQADDPFTKAMNGFNN